MNNSNNSSFTKPLISKQKLPLLITSMNDPTPSEIICTMRNAIYDGTEAFSLHLEMMKQEHINEEDLRRICNYAGDKPIYTMNYRIAERGKTDEQLTAEQLMGVRAGSSMIDFMGDMFDRTPRELTQNSSAIERQREVIEEVHSLGAEVMMSSHIFDYLTMEETLEHAQALEARGGDIVKIASAVRSEEEMIEALRTTVLVKNKLNVPFLHVCMGQWGKLLRAVSPMFGSCFAICGQTYKPVAHMDQPLLRAQRAVLDNVDWMHGRDTAQGTIGGGNQG